MKIVTPNKNHIAIGMSWARLSGEKPKAELVGLSNEVGRKFGFLRSIPAYDGSRHFQAALISGSEYKGVISGAASLADRYSELLFVSLVADDCFWICAISGNEVLAGGDRLVDQDGFSSCYSDILDSFGNTEDLKIVFCQDAVDTLQVSLDDIDEVQDFDGLIEASGVKKFSKEFAHCRIVAIKAGSNTLLLTGAAISLCVLAYHFAGPGFGSKSEPVVVFDDHLADQNAILVKKNAENAEREVKKKAYAEEISWINDDIVRYGASPLLKRIYSLYELTPKYINGWVAKQIIYSNKNRNSVQVLWQKDIGGTPITLRESGLNADSFNFDMSGKTAISYHNVIVPDDREIDVYELIRKNAYNYEMLIHDASTIGLSLKMSSYTKTDRPIPIAGIENKEVAKTRLIDLDGKTITISGSTEDDYLVGYKVLSDAKVFKINKITINLDGGFKWSIDGDLYESVK